MGILMKSGICYTGSGGSAVPYTQEVIWDYVTDNSGAIPFDMYNKTLHRSIDNYDELIVEFISSSSDVGDATWGVTYQWVVDVADLKSAYVNNNLAYSSYGTRASRFYISGTTFQKVGGDTSTHGLVKVVGVKFGSGSGEEPQAQTITLLENSWTATTSPMAEGYTITVAVTGVTTTSNQEILPLEVESSADVDNNDALINAQISDAGQTDGYITLFAKNLPEDDLQIRVIVRA